MIYLLILLSGASFPPSGDVWKPVSGSWNTPVLQADNATWEHSAVQEVSCVRSINSSLPPFLYVLLVSCYRCMFIIGHWCIDMSSVRTDLIAWHLFMLHAFSAFSIQPHSHK